MATLPKPQRGSADEALPPESPQPPKPLGPELVPRDRMMLLGLEAARLPLPEEPVATGWPAARERFLRWYWETTAQLRAGQGPRTLFWLRLGIRWWLNADFHNVQLP